jgi:Spy/CpxP family protein refolding chaperone
VTRLVVALAVALAVLAPAVADAQPAPGPGRPGRVDRREQIKKKIRALRAYTLTEELALDEATATKLFPILARYDDELGKRVALRVKLRQDLEAAADRGDDAAVDKSIDELVANQKALVDLDAQRFAELRKVLTPRQAGRLLVVLPALERKVQNMLDRALSGRRGRMRARGADFEE